MTTETKNKPEVTVKENSEAYKASIILYNYIKLLQEEEEKHSTNGKYENEYYTLYIIKKVKEKQRILNKLTKEIEDTINAN